MLQVAGPSPEQQHAEQHADLTGSRAAGANRERIHAGFKRVNPEDKRKKEDAEEEDDSGPSTVSHNRAPRAPR